VPLRNRVTPFGEIVAVSQRGQFTGNRGIIHDPATKTLLNRRWTSNAWLICRLDFRNVRRDVMSGRSWTELFFLDEASALAAGHRPCFFCRRESALAFRAYWAAGNGGAQPKAKEMDAILHGERRRVGPPHPAPGAVEDLPDGAMVAVGEQAFVINSGRPFSWSWDGYRPAGALTRADGLLTPPSTLAALRSGYHPALHPSIDAWS
jgi:hypothetical protein